jgi:hypothetical protein
MMMMMMITASRFVLATFVIVAAATIGVTTAVDGYGPLPSEVSVGDEICVYGFVMDRWCIVDVSFVSLSLSVCVFVLCVFVLCVCLGGISTTLAKHKSQKSPCHDTILSNHNNIFAFF